MLRSRKIHILMISLFALAGAGVVAHPAGAQTLDRGPDVVASAPS
jgi:hypothetical protein